MKKNLKPILLWGSLLASSTFLILYGLNDNIVFFYVPKQLNQTLEKKKIRVGGLVSNITYNGAEISFLVSDDEKEIEAFFTGVLPPLFKEGQGVVMYGYLKNSKFYADTILAKHDENYKPK